LSLRTGMGLPLPVLEAFFSGNGEPLLYRTASFRSSGGR
jgi:hypothetical protein